VAGDKKFRETLLQIMSGHVNRPDGNAYAEKIGVETLLMNIIWKSTSSANNMLHVGG